VQLVVLQLLRIVIILPQTSIVATIATIDVGKKSDVSLLSKKENFTRSTKKL
jgi:hypothetical protein